MRSEKYTSTFASILCGAASMLLTAATAHALPREDTQEVFAAAGFNRQIGSGSGTFNADLSYGRYLDPNWQLGIQQQFNYTLADESSDVWYATTSPFINYHFAALNERQTVIPFIGGLVGAVWNEEEFTGTVGPQGGFKFYFDDDTFLATRYHYQWFFDELKEVDETIDSAHIVTLGIGYNW